MGNFFHLSALTKPFKQLRTLVSITSSVIIGQINVASLFTDTQNSTRMTSKRGKHIFQGLVVKIYLFVLMRFQ